MGQPSLDKKGSCRGDLLTLAGGQMPDEFPSLPLEPAEVAEPAVGSPFRVGDTAMYTETDGSLVEVEASRLRVSVLLTRCVRFSCCHHAPSLKNPQTLVRNIFPHLWCRCDSCSVAFLRFVRVSLSSFFSICFGGTQ